MIVASLQPLQPIRSLPAQPQPSDAVMAGSGMHRKVNRMEIPVQCEAIINFGVNPFFIYRTNRVRLLFQHLFKFAEPFTPAILGAFESISICESGLFEMKVNLSVP